VKKKIIAALVAASGIGLLLVGNFIMGEVEIGRQKIARAESKVGGAQRLFSMNPVSEKVGQGMMGGVRKKLRDASAEADYYAHLARALQVGGGVLIAVGVGLFFWRRK
jgi:hypothetical protein